MFGISAAWIVPAMAQRPSTAPIAALFILSPSDASSTLRSLLPQREVVTSCWELYMTGIMSHLDLSDDKAAALIKELRTTIDNDRYPFSNRVHTLKAILAKLRPKPVRELLPPPKICAPLQATAAKKTVPGLNGCCGLISS